MTSIHHHPYDGVFTALATPLLPDLTIDWTTLEAYVTHKDHQEVKGWVVGGTTGEGMLLSPDELRALIGRIKTWCPWAMVIAGVTGLTTETLVTKVHHVQASGAHAALVLTPYYVKPSQDALVQVLRSLHDQTKLPMILYHNPGRTGVGLDIDTLVTLSALERYVGLKDSTHDLTRPLAIRAALQGRPWALLCGEDDMFLPYTACGGSGIISVQSGLVPGYYARLWNAMQGQWTLAQQLAWDTAPLHAAMKPGANPVSVKTALALLGWGHERMRSCVGSFSVVQKQALHAALMPMLPVMPSSPLPQL